MRSVRVFVVQVSRAPGSSEFASFSVRAVEEGEAVRCDSPADVVRLLMRDRPVEPDGSPLPCQAPAPVDPTTLDSQGER